MIDIEFDKGNALIVAANASVSWVSTSCNSVVTV